MATDLPFSETCMESWSRVRGKPPPKVTHSPSLAQGLAEDQMFVSASPPCSHGPPGNREGAGSRCFKAAGAAGTAKETGPDEQGKNCSSSLPRTSLLFQIAESGF